MLSKFDSGSHVLEYTAILVYIFPKNSSTISRLCKRSNVFRNGLPNADTRIIKVLTADSSGNLCFTSEYNDKKSKIEAEIDFIGSAFLEFELKQTLLAGHLDEQQHCCGCELF